MKKVKERVELYHRIAVRVVGLGMVGPTKPVMVSEYHANKLIEKSNEWSLTPFKKEDEVIKDA